MRSILLRLWRRTVRHIGHSGHIALLLLLVSGATATWIPRLELERQRTQADVAARSTALRNRGPAPPREPSADERLAQYVQAFPRPNQMAADLGQIFAGAERHHVELSKGEYQLKSEPGALFASYIVSLPVHAEYGPLKAFTSNVLMDLPHASLDELRVSRETSTVDALDAAVRFTLVYRNR